MFFMCTLFKCLWLPELFLCAKIKAIISTMYTMLLQVGMPSYAIDAFERLFWYNFKGTVPYANNPINLKFKL